MGVICPLASIVLGIATYAAYSQREIGSKLALAALTCNLLVFVGAQIVSLRRVHPDRWLLNPATLASVWLFVIGYGITNMILYLPSGMEETIGSMPEISDAMVRLSGLSLVAALSMWAGYWSITASSVPSSMFAAQLRAQLFPDAASVRPLVIPSLVTASVVARLALIWLGAFGYSSTPEDVLAAAHITQYLVMIGLLGKLALALAALQCYWGGANVSGVLQLSLILALEMMLGLLSGFKSAIVLPFAIVGVCHYLVTGRIRRLWLGCACLALVAAYQIVEPFRTYRDQSNSFERNSLRGIVGGVIESRIDDSGVASDSLPLLLRVCSRLNLTVDGSYGLEHAREIGLTEQDPLFLRNLLLAPVHAWVPRFVWAGKPLGTDGNWYYQSVMGRFGDSSAAMGPITYLYFAGGVIAVIVGFYLLGFIQRVLWFWLEPWRLAGGAVVLLGIISTIGLPSSSVDATIIYLCRDVPLMIGLQLVVLRRVAVPRHRYTCTESSF